MTSECRIALLIDCDNVSHQAIGGVIDELSKYGKVNIRRAYGDWKQGNLIGWEDKLHPYAIKPIQQFAYTKGKNATDAAMIIDAMDLLYTQKLDAFALMTSDSDFTPLAMRILTSGLTVYGFGGQKTPSPFVKACSQFIFTENLVSAEEVQAEKPVVKSGETVAKAPVENLKKTREQLRKDTGLVKLLRTAAEQTTENDGWSNFSHVSQYVSNNSSFSSVNYGYKRLSDLVKASELFDMEIRNGGPMFIRDAKKKSAK